MMYEQLSLFDMAVQPEISAVCCMDGRAVAIRNPDSWMLRLVPHGEYVVDVDNHPLVLQPVKTTADKIPQGHEFYHYLIGKKVYSGIFVGAAC